MMQHKIQTAGLLALSMLMAHQAHAEELTLNLKNAYIQRDYSEVSNKDAGSWSQGVSAFYKSDYTNTLIQMGFDASVQYAYRLSADKHRADTVLPFENGNQDLNFLKYGGTAKFKYQDTELKLGELWLNLPITSIDASRQLLSSYWGGQLKSKINPDLTVEVGRVERVSPRNQEGFHPFSLRKDLSPAGTIEQSGGLNYLDVTYKVTPALNAEYYFGNMEDLYDKHYLGLNYAVSKDAFKAKTTFKYFNSSDSGSSKAGHIDNQNIGLMQNLSYKNHSFGLGYQQMVGDTGYPIPEGFLPELYFINWNTTGFFKKDEKSVHLTYGYDFKDYVPGLNFLVKHAHGYDFKTSNKNDRESETDWIVNYQFTQPKLKGLGFQWILIDYRAKYGNDFLENRVLTTYTKKF